MRRRGLTIIWPQYFDADRTVKEGRRIPKELAISKPTVNDLFLAAQRLKLEVEADTSAKYPRSTWDAPGLILVDTKGMKKNTFLKKFAPAVQRAQDYRKKSESRKHKKSKKNKEKSYKELLKEKLQEQKK